VGKRNAPQLLTDCALKLASPVLRSFCALLLPATLALTACANYDVTVNDTLVYGPGRLFTGYQVEDPALQTCLEQTIKDQNVTAAAQLTALNCSRAGIESLAGLEAFNGLVELRLSGNRIRNLVVLGGLQQLQVLALDDNRIVDPVPLYSLPALRWLDLEHNPALQCPRRPQWQALQHYRPPQHCAPASS
jgi:Leucine-rich repeat (LRR) protein